MFNILKSSANKTLSLKFYHGYGHTHNLVLYGHVFYRNTVAKQLYSNNFFKNIKYLYQIFNVKPAPSVEVWLNFNGSIIKTTSERDGFLKFQWSSNQHVEAGLHKVNGWIKDLDGEILAESEGYIYVPHITQLAIVSDIDDTIMISHSSKIGQRLRELFVKHPRTRKSFPGIKEHFKKLALAKTTIDQPNPFFYVSSSEWNLYEYLKEMFRFNELPEGTFLLNNLKTLSNFLKTGKTGHHGKLLRIMRIIDTFPNQKFVFFGDNSQLDPQIYAEIAQKYRQNIVAVYIRNVRRSKINDSLNYIEKINAYHIPALLYKNSFEAIEHSKTIGLFL